MIQLLSLASFCYLRTFLHTTHIMQNRRNNFSVTTTFIQRRLNVFDVGPTLYKCHTNVYWVLTDVAHVDVTSC